MSLACRDREREREKVGGGREDLLICNDNDALCQKEKKKEKQLMHSHKPPPQKNTVPDTFNVNEVKGVLSDLPFRDLAVLKWRRWTVCHTRIWF